jgi:hypothetical protein
MKHIFFVFLFFNTQTLLEAQTNDSTLPYREIPSYPDTFTPETVVARMIDGLGFRYFWATEGLRTKDLSFRPTDSSRSSEETIDHILDLSQIIINSLKGVTNVISGEETLPMSFEQKRKKTLDNLKISSDLLKSPSIKLKDIKIIFQNGDNKSEFPFWNQINGQIADALWHVGQVVSLRRTSGNPINPKVDVFTGTVLK